MSFFSKLWSKGRGESTANSTASDPIDAFWAWWSTVSDELASSYESKEPPSSELVDQISERVKAIHSGLAWETAPGVASQHQFAISGEGDAGLRLVAQRWLSRAPKPSPRWEYYAARQRGGADARCTLSIQNRDFQYADFKITTQVDEARAVVDVVVYHPHFAAMPEPERLQPLFLFLDDVLGEDDVTSWIGSVDSASELPAEASGSGALLEAVRQLREGHDDERVTLLKGTRAGAPVIALVRLSLKRLDYLLHDHHLELTFTIREPSEDGLHTAEEGDELNALEDGLIAELSHRVVWIGHETFGGKRVAHFHADSTADIQRAIESYCEAHGHWEVSLAVKADPEWAVLSRY
jgi:hypothetical protein